MHWAAYRGDAEAIAALLGGGAGPNAKDDTGGIPLSLVIRSDHPNAHDVLFAHTRTVPDFELLLTLAANGGLDAVDELLRADPDPNVRDGTHASSFSTRASPSDIISGRFARASRSRPRDSADFAGTAFSAQDS